MENGDAGEPGELTTSIPLDMQIDDLLSRLLSAGAGEDARCTGGNVADGDAALSAAAARAEMGQRGLNEGCPGCWLGPFKTRLISLSSCRI